MKGIFAVTLFALSLAASAFEIQTGSLKLPENVRALIHEQLERVCAGEIGWVKSIKLVDQNIEQVRIDQGYRENHYTLNFKVIYSRTHAPKDFYSVKVVDVIEDRSGHLDTYITEFNTTACQF